MIDWSPLLQTALGATVALGSSYLLHKHQAREAVRAETRTTYVEMLEMLTNMAEKIDLRKPPGEERAEAMKALGRAVLIAQLLGSQELVDRLKAIGDEVGALKDEKDLTFFKELPESWRRLLKRHQGPLLNAMRKDLGLKPLERED